MSAYRRVRVFAGLPPRSDYPLVAVIDHGNGSGQDLGARVIEFVEYFLVKIAVSERFLKMFNREHNIILASIIPSFDSGAIDSTKRSSVSSPDADPPINQCTDTPIRPLPARDG